MRQLEEDLNLNVLLELKPVNIGDFCENALGTGTLIEELEEFGPFPLRKDFCKFLGIGESTLTGWLKAEQMPRMAKIAYVLLVGVTRMQGEIGRLRGETHELKIIQDGNIFQLVQFEKDETGVSIGRIVARDIPNAKTARVLAGSLKAFRMLQETREVIEEMLERTENDSYKDDLEELYNRINKETFAAFDPDKWRELYGAEAHARQEAELLSLVESLSANALGTEEQDGEKL